MCSYSSSCFFYMEYQLNQNVTFDRFAINVTAISWLIITSLAGIDQSGATLIPLASKWLNDVIVEPSGWGYSGDDCASISSKQWVRGRTVAEQQHIPRFCEFSLHDDLQKYIVYQHCHLLVRPSIPPGLPGIFQILPISHSGPVGYHWAEAERISTHTVSLLSFLSPGYILIRWYLCPWATVCGQGKGKGNF